MASHHELGKKGERLAAAFLLKKQYQLLHTNWQWGRKEIDIVARQGGAIIFVEVKTRSTQAFGMPEEAVHGRKELLLQQAAEAYLHHHGLDPECIRFDVIAVTLGVGKEEIMHLEDAF